MWDVKDTPRIRVRVLLHLFCLENQECGDLIYLMFRISNYFSNHVCWVSLGMKWVGVDYVMGVCALQNYRDIGTSEGSSAEHWWRSCHNHPFGCLSNPLQQCVSLHLQFSYTLFPSNHNLIDELVLWTLPFTNLPCQLHEVAHEVNLKEGWTICGWHLQEVQPLWVSGNNKQKLLQRFLLLQKKLHSEQFLVFAKLAMHMNICLIHVDVISLGRGKHC